MADSITRELQSLRCADGGEYDSELSQDRQDRQQRAATLLAGGERIVATCMDMHLYLCHFLRTQPISLPLGELDAIWEATEGHLRTVDECPCEYQKTKEFFDDVEVLPWDDSACNRRRQLLQGLFDALDAAIEVLDGCMSEVRELAADAPNWEQSVIERVKLIHHLFCRAHDLSGCLHGFLEHDLRQSTVELTSRCKRQRRLGGGLQRVPMSREEHDAMVRKQRAQWARLRECSNFIVEHLPLLHRQRRTPAWVYWYPEWTTPQPNPVALWLNALAGLRARIEQRWLQQDIDSAPDVIAKFRLRPRRVARRRIDSVAPLAAARARVGTPAAAVDAAAGPMLPDGERPQQRPSKGGRAAAGAAALQQQQQLHTQGTCNGDAVCLIMNGSALACRVVPAAAAVAAGPGAEP
ncbi:hypothetical protein JKP88DRAFT_289694 [Tribonema minus]|uniref:Uncharacterized protein n=1 Tax=Tribonema minus TaxID=303371 RepID=A0A835Z208_9STRA|nr:hypothetical protein JKP88DRAFT_289694 [Tribonema minus]